MTVAKILWRAPDEMSRSEQSTLRLLVEEVSQEFVPPLTARSGTTQAILKDATDEEPNCYFDEILKQHNLLLVESDQLHGFLSFRPSHHDVRLPQIEICLYVSTIVTHPLVRGRGFARLLYQKLFELPETFSEWVLLRTWSTNTAHLPLLHSLGFKLLLTVPNDRGLGVDTLYLATKRR